MSAHPQSAAMTIDEFRAILEAADLDIGQTAKLLGVPISTVHRWLHVYTPISQDEAILIRDRIKIVNN